jgi:hypothetical protein
MRNTEKTPKVSIGIMALTIIILTTVKMPEILKYTLMIILAIAFIILSFQMYQKLRAIQSSNSKK